MNTDGQPACQSAAKPRHGDRFLVRCTSVKLVSPSTPATHGKLIDIFCHAIRITDPLSIKIAVGVIGGGLPLFFLFALFIMLGELAARQRENTMPVSHEPDRRKGRAARPSPSTRK